jgi:hypothetical protein
MKFYFWFLEWKKRSQTWNFKHLANNSVRPPLYFDCLLVKITIPKKFRTNKNRGMGRNAVLSGIILGKSDPSELWEAFFSLDFEVFPFVEVISLCIAPFTLFFLKKIRALGCKFLIFQGKLICIFKIRSASKGFSLFLCESA